MCVALLGAVAGGAGATGGLGTVLSVVSTLGGAIMQYQSQNAAAKAAQATAAYNAETARMQAEDARERGKEEAQLKQREVAARISAFQAEQSAGGVDIGYGSPLMMAASSAKEGAADVATVRKNAERQATSYERQAGLYLAEGANQAAAARAQGRTALLGGVFDSYSALEPLGSQWDPLRNASSNRQYYSGI